MTSELAKVEVVGACRRVNADAIPQARALLAELDLVPLSGEVIEMAAGLEPLRPGAQGPDVKYCRCDNN